MQRRTFVTSALAIAGLSLMARGLRAQQQFWDYIIVGAGTAGLPAAIFA